MTGAVRSRDDLRSQLGHSQRSRHERSDVDSKAGQVLGNIVSDWTQVLGLVVLTKYAREIGSKEGQ